MELGVGLEPTIFGSQNRCIAIYACPANWSPSGEFNSGPHPYQGCALTSELQGHGAEGGNRNRDLRVTNAALSHLSYVGEKLMERVIRFELTS